jgi:hypothetical protein
LHFLLSFIGQFLPLFLQLAASAAKLAVQTAAARIENKIFMPFFMSKLRPGSYQRQGKISSGKTPSQPLSAGGHLIIN